MCEEARYTRYLLLFMIVVHSGGPIMRNSTATRAHIAPRCTLAQLTWSHMYPISYRLDTDWAPFDNVGDGMEEPYFLSCQVLTSRLCPAWFQNWNCSLVRPKQDPGSGSRKAG